MEVCLYFGSFNPIHNAHLEVAKYVHAQLNVEKIVFIPAFIPPHKDLKEFDGENAMHRLNMVELAVKEYPFFDVSAIEYTRNKPSYTYDTVVQINEIVRPKEKIHIIIGTDAFCKIETWHNADKLKELVNFILFVREDNFNEAPFEQLRKKGYNYTLMKMPYIDISSTEVRNKVRQGVDVSDLLPRKVEEYIKSNDVY